DDVGERRCMPIGVLEAEHADAARLAVAGHGEVRPAGGGSDGPEGGGDWLHLVGRTVSEEGEGDVEVGRRDDADVADVGEGGTLPVHEPADDVGGQHQGQEEARSLTTTDASSGLQTRS